ncbi:MAG: hypothetical protein ABGX16_14920 [Pirellulales bacterium]
MTLTARRNHEVLNSGPELAFAALSVSVAESGWLTVDAREEQPDNQQHPFELEVSLQIPGHPIQSQKLQVRPAPPTRPISYLADLVDDLIRIFWDPEAGHFRKIEKSGFDQYFRRLQAHGVGRLIV